jgi:hypothetical protein
MEWGNGKFFNKVPSTRYEVEHILEWQLVTGFFEWMSKTYHGAQTKFDVPGNSGKVNFCEYWTETWKDAKSFPLPGRPTVQTPLDYIRQEYPSKTNEYKDEFVWLERTLNRPAKAEVCLFVLLISTGLLTWSYIRCGQLRTQEVYTMEMCCKIF